MKIVECEVCKYAPELTDEQIEQFAIIARGNKLKVDKYLRLFSVGLGHYCPDGKEHKFVLQDDLELEVDNIVKEYKNSIDVVNKNTKALEDHKKTLEKLLGMIEKAKEAISVTEGLISVGNTKINNDSTKILERTKIPIEAYI